MSAPDLFPQEIIRRKRDGETLSEAEIAFMAAGLTAAAPEQRLGDGQVAAFAMAVFLRGMSRAETVALTRAMAASGRVMDWRAEGLDGPILDKHSTGGVGDKVSLILAPLVAACGGFVPMIAGRGLGHTGGTLDKLEAIPGYDVAPDRRRFTAAVGAAGCAIMGQTADLAPADRRLYALRDVTATVESVPLITASILSKKLAAGLDALVMDVKAGNGAFMATPEAAAGLAETIVDVAQGAGLRTSALITDMNQVLGRTAGNALEIREAIDFLTGAEREPRLAEVTLALAAELLLLGGLAPDPAAARARAEAALADGRAAGRFAAMVAALGGPGDLVDRPQVYLPKAPVVRPFPAGRDGYVSRVDTRAVGLAVMALGGGRRRAEDEVDHAVGLDRVLPLGAAVSAGKPLAVIHARDDAGAGRAAEMLKAAIGVGEAPLNPAPLIYERLTSV